MTNNHKVTNYKLKNGIEGLLINVPNASVMAMQFNFRAGHYLANPEKWEVPHIMEHLSLGANKRFKKAREFEAELRKNGAYTNASTSNYSINYSAECADFEWDRILDLMLLAISEPAFHKHEFEAEVGNVKDELIGRSNNHFRTLAVAATSAFGLVSKSDMERVSQLDKIGLEDIIDFYKKTHLSGNLRFVIAGKLDQRVSKILDKFEQIPLKPSSVRIELPDEAPKSFKKPVVIANSEVPNLHFDITTFHKGKFFDEDWDAAGLVNNILTETLYSKILGEAREKGLAYDVSSGFELIKNYVGFTLGGQIIPANILPLLDISVREIGKVINGEIEAEDIEAAKQYALGRYQLSAQTVSGILRGYASRYYFEDTIDDYYAIPNRIKAVTLSRMQDVMKRVFADNIWGVTLLGKSNKKLENEIMERLKPLWP